MDQMKLPLHADESAPNVFDMDLECEQAHEAVKASPQTPAAPSVAPAVGKAFRMRPAYFILVSALVAAVWIGWPALSPQANKGISLDQQIPAALAPTSASAQAAPASESVAPAPIASQSTPPDASIPSPSSASPAVSVGAQILREQASQATAMITAIDSMAVRLSDLEARVLAMSLPRVTGATTSTIVPPKSTGARRGPPRVLMDTASVEKPASPAYQLNTIFRDQAWIAFEDSIHVVQAGDRLGELTIVRVDAAAHRVITTAGVIR